MRNQKVVDLELFCADEESGHIILSTENGDKYPLFIDPIAGSLVLGLKVDGKEE
jgi:hypothetical protein